MIYQSYKKAMQKMSFILIRISSILVIPTIEDQKMLIKVRKES